MRKILIFSALAAITITACKKKEAPISTTYTYSAPTITITGSQYYSIPVGGILPSISAVAYDSFYHESYPVIVDQSTLDNNTPGLYSVLATAKNKYGMMGSTSVYVAVTDVSDTLDLTGWYLRLASADRAAHVTKLAKGMFMTSNVGGVDTSDPATGASIAAVFAVTSLTEIDFGTQMTSEGTLSASNAMLDLIVPDTTFSYVLSLSGFSATAVRSFVKQ